MIDLCKLCKDFTAFRRESKEEFGKSAKERCRDLNLIDLARKIRRMQLLQMWQKKYWLLIPLLMILLLHLLTKHFEISAASYFIFAFIGILCQFFSGFFFVKAAIKDPYRLALDTSSRLGHNPDAIRNHLDSSFDTALGWFFLYIGILVQMIALLISLIIMLKK